MIIKLKNLTKKYGDVIALNNINIDFLSGELVCLLGPSGSGKTTLLFAVAGLIELDQGQIFFNDVDISLLPASKRKVGIVFQDFGLFPYQSVYDTICFPLKMQQLNKVTRDQRVQEIASLLHIENLLKRKTKALSAGQKQRVAIARAIAMEPDVLLFDESLNHLDQALRIEMRKEIKKLQKQLKITTIFVTHDYEEAKELADRIVILNKGAIIENKLV